MASDSVTCQHSVILLWFPWLQVVMAFWKAVGGEEEEVVDVGDDS